MWLHLHSHFSPTILKIFQEKQRKLRHKDEFCLTWPHVIIYPVPAGIPQLEWCVGWFWTWVVFYEEKTLHLTDSKGTPLRVVPKLSRIIGLHHLPSLQSSSQAKTIIYDNPRYWEMPTTFVQYLSISFFKIYTPAMNSWVLSVSPFQLRKSGNQPQGWMDVLPRKHPRSFPENEWLVQMCFLLKRSSLL